MRAVVVCFFFLVLWLSSPPIASAIPTTYPKLRDQQARVTLQGTSFLTPSSTVNSDAGKGYLGLHVGGRAVGNKESFQYGAEGEFLFGLRTPNFRYLDVGELYIGSENPQSSE